MNCLLFFLYLCAVWTFCMMMYILDALSFVFYMKLLQLCMPLCLCGHYLFLIACAC